MGWEKIRRGDLIHIHVIRNPKITRVGVYIGQTSHEVFEIYMATFSYVHRAGLFRYVNSAWEPEVLVRLRR